MNVTNIKKLDFSTLLAIEWSIYVVISLAANFISYFDRKTVGQLVCDYVMSVLSACLLFSISPIDLQVATTWGR